MALDPVRCDLDVYHPIFRSSVGDIFRAFSSESSGAANGRKSSAKAVAPLPPLDFASVIIPRSGSELGWVEILCRPPASRKTSTSQMKPVKFRWMHVDPGHELVDQPGSVETLFEAMNRDDSGSRKRKRPIAYALSVEHVPAISCNQNDTPIYEEGECDQVRLTDVTPRYVESWSKSLEARSAKRQRSSAESDNTWWTESLKQINSFYHSQAKQYSKARLTAALRKIGTSPSEAIEIEISSDEEHLATEHGSKHLNGHDTVDVDEKAELLGAAASETIPTSKAAFNNHPIYAIPSVLNMNEVLAPDAKNRICGIFKGEPVYRRSDVHTALIENKWLYQGRKVKEEELGNPVKRVKARKKAAPKGFQPLQSYGVGDGNDGSKEAQEQQIALGSKPEEENDGMNDLYAFWQTMPWSPEPVGPNDPIPVNDYNNIELELLNPGLEHMEEPRVSQVAKKLGM